MSANLYFAVGLVLVLVGAGLVATDLHDVWRARDFWRAMRSGVAEPVPAYWDGRYVMAPLTLWTEKIVGGCAVALAGVAVSFAGLRARRGGRS